MNHLALASLRAKHVAAHVGFPLSSNLTLDEALHAAVGVGVGAVGMRLYMSHCRGEMVRWAKKAEVTHEGMAKAAGIDKSEAEHHLGAAVAYARCARKIGSEDRG
jgi:hypothetical protein